MNNLDIWSRGITIVLFTLICSAISQGRVINVVDFGAKGDGKSNNTKAFETAVNNLSEGDQLYIPPGKYKLEHFQVVGKKSIVIRGGGELSAINGGNSYFVILKSSPNILLENLVIDGMYTKNIGVDIIDSPGGKLSNIKVRKIRGDRKNWSAGIRLRKNTDYFQVTNSSVEEISSKSEAAVGIWVSIFNGERASKGIQINKVNISYIDSPTDGDGIKIQQIEQASDAVIEGCYFFNTRKRAVKIQSSNVLVKNNVVERTGNYGNGFSAFSIYGGNIDLSNNKFVSRGNSSINMFVDVSAYSNIKIISNECVNSKESTASVKDFVNLKRHSTERKEGVSNVIISQNKASNIRHFVFLNADCDDILIKDNEAVGLTRNFVSVNDGNSMRRANMQVIKNVILAPARNMPLIKSINKTTSIHAQDNIIK